MRTILARTAVAVLAAALASLGVAVGAPASTSGPARAATAGAVPQKLVGQWSRTVTQADQKRTGGYGAPAGAYTLRIKKSGAAEFYGPGGGLLISGTLSASPSGRVIVKVGCYPFGVYRWKVSSGLLTFTKVKDESCGDRVAVVAGTWKKR